LQAFSLQRAAQAEIKVSGNMPKHSLTYIIAACDNCPFELPHGARRPHAMDDSLTESLMVNDACRRKC
jgi:hypothetical protein